MPIPVEKAIPLRVVAVPAFPTHIFYGVTLQGEENILSELALGKLRFKSTGPLCNGFLAVLIRDVSIAHHPLENLPVGIALERLGQGR